MAQPTRIPPIAPEGPHPLTRLRFERGMSQRELERLTLVSRTTIARIESRQVRPQFSTVLAIAAALDCDADLLDELLRPNAP